MRSVQTAGANRTFFGTWSAGVWLRGLRDLAQDWLVQNRWPLPPASAQTPAYVDLLFAFGLARLSEADAVKLAESLPPPVFDADRRLRQLDEIE